MYLLKFQCENKKFFLHNGIQFVGAENEKMVHLLAVENLAKFISVGGFEVVEVKDSTELSILVGGVPYKIFDFHGGFGIPFMGVEIIYD